MNMTTPTSGLTGRQWFASSIGELNKNDPSPLYLQLQMLIRSAIYSGELAVDVALPAERHLAEDFDVSRITVRKAIDGLAAQGLVIKRRGAGTFVTRPFEKNFSKLSSFTEEMISRGRMPRSEWLTKTTGVVTPEESLALGLSPGAEVCRFVRLRYADSTLMALEYATLPSFCLPPLGLITSSLYAALQLTGHRPVRALQRLRAVNLEPEQAEKLGVTAGEAGLLIERRGFLADGRTCELSHSYYRGDAYDVVAELNEASGL
jgi:GntR family transcriptional regulator